MDRSALLKLIHKDIDELQLLLQGMEGYADIPKPIITLAKNKAEQLNESIHDLPGEVLVPLSKVEESVEPVVESLEEIVEEPTEEPEAAAESDVEVQNEILDKEVEEKPITVVEEAAVLAEPEIKAPTELPKSKSTFGDTIVASEKVFDRIKNDISNSLSAKLEGSPIKDLKRGININDRFMFQKELFANNADDFNTCINSVNSMSTFDDALGFLLENYNWNYEDDITKRFVLLVNRRYK